jgi:hypothetical protein
MTINSEMLEKCNIWAGIVFNDLCDPHPKPKDMLQSFRTIVQGNEPKQPLFACVVQQKEDILNMTHP